MGGLDGGSENTTAAAELRTLVDANADLLRAAYGRQIRPDPTAIERNLLASRTRNEIQQRVDTAAAELIAETSATVAEVNSSDPAAARGAVLDAEVGFTDWFDRRHPLLVEAHTRGIRPTSLPVPPPLAIMENFVLALFDPDITFLTDELVILGDLAPLFAGVPPWEDAWDEEVIHEVRIEAFVRFNEAARIETPAQDAPPDTTIMDEMEQGSAMAGSDATGWDEVVDRLIAERVARRAQFDWKPAWDDLTGSLPYSSDGTPDLSDQQLQQEVDAVASRLVQTVQPHAETVVDQLRNQDRLPPRLREMYQGIEALEAVASMKWPTTENAHTALFLAMLTLEPRSYDDGMTPIDPEPPPPPPPDTTIMDEMEPGSAMAGSDATGWDKIMDRKILLRTTLAAIGIAALFGIWVLTTGDDETPPPTTQVAAETTSSTAEPEPEPEPEPPSDFSVTSDDGNVVIEVPGGAVDPDTQLTVTVLAREKYPKEVADAGQNPGTVIYRVEPTDAVFFEPVRFTRRLPASNFEGLPNDAIPFIVLVGHDADGYEQLNSGEILRDGDDIFVSGWMSRPQTVISVFEQAFLQPAGLGTSTMIGSTSEFGIQASTVAGEALDPGTDMVASASSDAGRITTTAIGPLLRLQCDIAGTDRLQTSWSTIVPTPPSDGLLGVRYASTLVPEVKPGFLFSLFVDHECVEAPEVYTAGIEFIVDHPGGVVNAQGEDFAGGASAVLIRLNIDPTPGEVLVGLFLDADQNGGISTGDLMTSPQAARGVNGSALYVVPIFDFGYYIPYFVFADQFGELPSEPGLVPVRDGLQFLRDQHTGDGPFEDDVRMPILGDLPMIGAAFAQEQAVTEETELVVFVTAKLLDFES